MADASLDIEGLVAGYGQGVVLEQLSLSIASGEAVALMGLNGAGKTTLLKTIMGLVRARAGTISFGGERIEQRLPFEIARRGIAYVPQGREIFGDLTVEDNLLLGDLKAARPEEAYALFPALRDKRRDAAGSLSGGQQQQLAVARALMAHPRLLLLDEPSEGVQPSTVQDIAAILGRIAAERGMGLLLVEQNIDMVLAMTSRVIFIQHGHAAASERAEALRADPRLVETRLGL
jgi:ABC-type branched-subunit amino acid transport system ATPase component